MHNVGIHVNINISHICCFLFYLHHVMLVTGIKSQLSQEVYISKLQLLLVKLLKQSWQYWHSFIAGSL